MKHASQNRLLILIISVSFFLHFSISNFTPLKTVSLTGVTSILDDSTVYQTLAVNSQFQACFYSNYFGFQFTNIIKNSHENIGITWPGFVMAAQIKNFATNLLLILP